MRGGERGLREIGVRESEIGEEGESRKWLSEGVSGEGEREGERERGERFAQDRGAGESVQRGEK